MKERGIIFSAPMVRAILADQKTQTRRVVRPQWRPGIVPKRHSDGSNLWLPYTEDGRLANTERGSRKNDCTIRCPYGTAGDRLWLRETAWYGPQPDRVEYAADMDDDAHDAAATGGARLRPGILMPRWASRLTLLIEEVRVERLQAITEEDAIAEGMPRNASSAREAFAFAWDTINGKRAPWAASPWVWVIRFRRLEVTP